MFRLMLIFSVLLSCCGCMPAFPDTSATAEQAYALLAGVELPDSVTNIECHGDFWMDHSFSIRFNAADSDIEQILSAGYTATDWESIKYHMENPTYLDEFAGTWQPAEIESKSCYELAVKSPDGYCQQHLLVFDHEANLVYCVSAGSVSLKDPKHVFGLNGPDGGYD